MHSGGARLFMLQGSCVLYGARPSETAFLGSRILFYGRWCLCSRIMPCMASGRVLTASVRSVIRHRQSAARGASCTADNWLSGWQHASRERHARFTPGGEPLRGWGAMRSAAAGARHPGATPAGAQVGCWSDWLQARHSSALAP